jgi:hypothetical protein
MPQLNSQRTHSGLGLVIQLLRATVTAAPVTAAVGLINLATQINTTGTFIPLVSPSIHARTVDIVGA